MIKKIILALFILNLNLMPSYSFDFTMSPKAQIRSTINKHNKALSKHNIELVKTFYDKNYKNGDGLTLDDLISMLNKTQGMYENIKYKTKINSINAYDNWALVQMSDVTTARINPAKNKKIKKEKMGLLDGKSVYVVYLKKDKDEWKIISDDILMEETSLKYGIAKKIDMNLVTPAFIKPGENYDLSLEMNKPEDIIALASISREEIIYPPIDYRETFRKFPSEGNLERIVRANDRELGEYGIASIGFTKLSVNEQENKAKIEVLGMAYLMKRINVEKNKNLPVQTVVENN